MLPKNLEKIAEILAPLQIGDDTLEEVMARLEEHASKGLDPDTNMEADLKMYITYVRSVPDGSEVGDFLALDLGGTNFRVLLIRLNGSDEVRMENEIYIVPDTIMTGTGEQLFDHIADCISEFTTKYGVSPEQETPLGFTFSFPCKQYALNKASLATWTKGFNCSGVVGEDLVGLLHSSTAKKGLNVKCVAVINDTVGALMSCAYEDKACRIGLILGTGTNACYMEQISRVKTWDGDDEAPRQVIINCEWGAFGNTGCLDFVTTEHDKAVDENSINAGQQIYEKMISGMYMGEIARRVLVKLVDSGCLFSGEASDKLRKPMQFFTKYISEIESDQEFDNFTKTRNVLEELDIHQYSLADCMVVSEVCTVVSRRAAHLAAAGIATLLKRIDEPYITVAVDGSLYRYHPHFHDLITNKVKQLAPTKNFKLMLSNDGSGKGAALVAAVSWRLLQTFG